MPHIETPDGVPLYYEEQGEGKTILLIHGWTMNGGYWWQKNISSLAESYHVVTVDLRGHGLSGKTDENHRLVQYGRDIHHLLESLDLEDVTLVGWSMGTAVILNYLDQFGEDRLRSVVFVDQSPKFFSDDDWEYPVFGEFSAEALSGLLENLRFDRPGVVKPFIESMFADSPSEETVDEMYAETMKTPTSAATAILGDMAATDLRYILPEIEVPTLLLYGEQSTIFPGDVGQWMQNQIPDSELVTFAESGHCPFWEEPDKFNKTLAEFVG